MAGARNGPQVAAFVWLALFCVTAILGGSLVFSQAERQSVVELRIEGNEHFPVEKIVRYIHTRAGRPYDPDVVAEDVRRLMHTRMFVDVRPFTQRAAGGVVVVFRVRERKVLEYVKFVGNDKFSTKTLAKEVGLKKDDPFDRYAVTDGRRKIEEYYHSKGFPKVFIRIHEGEREGDRGVIYVIDEGPKARHLWTSFVGNTFASDGHLKTFIKSKPGILWVFGGNVDLKQIEEDKNRLTAYYRSMGFFEAWVGRELDYNEAENWLQVTFVISEGPRYQVRNVNIIGNSKFRTEDLAKDLKLTTGKYFNQNEMVADQLMMQDIYGGDGYVFAEWKSDTRFLEEPGKVDLLYNVVEGGRYRVGKINVRIEGDYPHTRLTTVYNRLSLRPGDIMDIRELRASERRLRASQLFAVDPTRNVYPKISFTRPARERREDESELADRPKPRGTFRGQSPDPRPYEAYRPPGWAGPPQEPITDFDVEIEAELNPDYPWPDEPIIRGQSPQSDADAAAGAGQPGAWNRTRLVAVDDGAAEPRQANGLESPRGQSNLRWLPSDPTIYRGQSGTYDGNEGYSTPVLSEQGPSGPAVRAPQVAPDLRSPVRPATPAAGSYPTTSYPATSYPANSYPAGPYPAGPANRLRPPYTSRLEGEPVSQPPLVGNQATINDAVPLLGTLPSEEPLFVPLEPILEETTTGRFIFSVGVNSDLGLLASVVIDEQNFDWTRPPHSWDDVLNGKAFRGAGQRFRAEAMPGTQLQRYTVSFTEPNLFDGMTSFGLSGYYFDRQFTEWTESHGGGRIALGRQLIPDLSVTFAYRGEDVHVRNPIVPPTAIPGIPDLNQVLGSNTLHGLGVRLTHDTRDNQFLATEGYLLDMGFEQVLGSFQYPRGDVDLRKYFLIRQHPDGSGRHVLSLGGRMAISGDDTPIYDRYFLGGFTTLRGFAFREASPRDPNYHVVVGGKCSLLANAEYMFPITADDMLRGVVFCDSGVAQPSINDWRDRYRVAVGFGLRITIPAMGPAPIALDFAFPISKERFDETQVFSFFIGFLR